jgi:hypothetical protein
MPWSWLEVFLRQELQLSRHKHGETEDGTLCLSILSPVFIRLELSDAKILVSSGEYQADDQEMKDVSPNWLCRTHKFSIICRINLDLG